MPPVVVKTVPQAGDLKVDPAVKAIKVTFSKAMLTKNNWSWVKVSPDTLPQITGNCYYLKDQRTCVLPVKLEPNKTYALWINKGQFNYFKDKSMNSALPYLLIFSTRK